MDRKEINNFGYKLGQWFATICMACLSALLIGVTIKLFVWLIF